MPKLNVDFRRRMHWMLANEHTMQTQCGETDKKREKKTKYLTNNVEYIWRVFINYRQLREKNEERIKCANTAIGATQPKFRNKLLSVRCVLWFTWFKMIIHSNHSFDVRLCVHTSKTNGNCIEVAWKERKKETTITITKTKTLFIHHNWIEVCYWK